MFVKGHKQGRGNSNSGRKSLSEEIAKVKDKITADALVELANKKVFAAINGADTHEEIKEMALPVTLKGMAEKIETKQKLILSFDQSFNKDAETSRKTEEHNQESAKI